MKLCAVMPRHLRALTAVIKRNACGVLFFARLWRAANRLAAKASIWTSVKGQGSFEACIAQQLAGGVFGQTFAGLAVNRDFAGFEEQWGREGGDMG